MCVWVSAHLLTGALAVALVAMATCVVSWPGVTPLGLRGATSAMASGAIGARAFHYFCLGLLHIRPRHLAAELLIGR